MTLGYARAHMNDYGERFNSRVADALTAATKSAPYPSLVGFEVVEQTPGRVVCRLPVREAIMNGVGVVHGGAIGSIVDHVLSIVVYPLVEVGRWVATLELKTSYLAPVREGEIVAEATVISLRKRLGTVRVDVHNVTADKRALVATALGTVYVRDKP